MPFKLKHLNFYSVDELPQGSDEWQMFRRDKITASNAYKLLLKGKNAAILENKKTTFDNAYTDRGHSLEFEVKEKLNAIIEKDGYIIREFGSVTNDKYPDCSYSPDGVMFPLSVDKITMEAWKKIPLIEVKCYNDVTISKDGTEKHPNKHIKCVDDLDNVPLAAIVQIQFGMMIAERDVCYLVLYNPDCEFKEKRMKIWTINRDEMIINRLKERLEK